MPLSQGQIINNRYRVVKTMAQGGFGTLYRVWDLNLKHACALKENTEIGPEDQRQFFREAQILSGLSHPNLPRVTDYFIVPGVGQYLVMDFIEGEDLDSTLTRQGPLPEAQVMSWMDQILDALAYLHSQKPPILHRDIKPANIRITPQGQAFLVDFGIAKQEAPGKATTSGAKAVTAGFSPPEQYTGGTTPRSDIYALGATMYTLLSGIFLPESISRVISAQPGANQPVKVKPLAATRPGISSKMNFAVMRAIEPEPNNRFQSVVEFRQALHQSSPVPPVSPPLQRPQPQATFSSIPPAAQQSPYQKAIPPLPKASYPSKRSIPKAVWIAGTLAILVVCALATVYVVNLFSHAITSTGPTPTTALAYQPTPADTAQSPSVQATATDAPANTDGSNQPSATPVSQATQAAPAVAPTDTQPAAQPVQLSQPDPTQLHIGEAWEQNGVEFNMIWLDVRATDNWEDAAFHVQYVFWNKSGQKILVEWNTRDFSIVDDKGNSYIDWEGEKATSTWVEAGAEYRFDRYYTTIPGERSRVPAGTNTVWVKVAQFSRIQNVIWRYDINPVILPISKPTDALKIGEIRGQGNLTLAITDVQISTTDSGGDAAVRVFYGLKNVGSDKIVVDIDFTKFYVLDSYGVRYMDWEGGGLTSRWLNPGDVWQFDRYYTTAYHERSRISPGSEFIVILVNECSTIQNVQWVYDIIR